MENKEYSIIGKVEIGTDEYRDLITSVAEYKAESENYRSKFWSKDTECDKLSKELEEANIKINRYMAFINSSEELKAKYKLWIIESFVGESEVEENA